MTQEFVVSGDSHVVEPMDLFTERLPKNLRDKALTQTEFELEEPLVPGGHTVFRTVHAPGYEGWTVSRYRQHSGPTPDWMPYLGPVDGVRGLIAAYGMSSHFFKHAPAVGRSLAELVVDGTSSLIDLAFFRPERIAQGAPIRSPHPYGSAATL